jgi:hypothetical protein
LTLPIPIIAVPTNTSKTIRVRLRERQGHHIADFRTYDEKGFSTKYGFELPVAQLTALGRAINEAIRRAHKLGIPTTHTEPCEQRLFGQLSNYMIQAISAGDDPLTLARADFPQVPEAFLHKVLQIAEPTAALLERGQLVASEDPDGTLRFRAGDECS